VFKYHVLLLIRSLEIIDILTLRIIEGKIRACLTGELRGI